MPKAIPEGLTREHVLKALDDLDGGIKHSFGNAKKFSLVHNNKQYPPKAVVGVAFRHHIGRILEPSEFSGGEDSGHANAVLRNLGFQVIAGRPFEVGKIYNRVSDIHELYGGQQQSGICTPKALPLIILFSSDAGHQHGYQDEFKEDGTYWYTGEGTLGDQQMVRGNRAILNHEENGKLLLIFESAETSNVRALGYGKYLGHHFATRPDKAGNSRQAIIFEIEILSSQGEQNDDFMVESSEEKPLTVSAINNLSLEKLRALALKGSRKTASTSQRRATVRNRSEAVRTYVRKRANGKCEGCGEAAPFINKKKQPYLESHHTHRLADKGLDCISHVIALCPTCHRMVHEGLDGDEYNEQLKLKLKRIEP